ncbi:hypothetical protein NEOKW01_1249 [Nematocida sp. AWRm80]|nr:hypothetical protein NEOKW01_1249 [Nematocida sp. AWRm80]
MIRIERSGDNRGRMVAFGRKIKKGWIKTKRIFSFLKVNLSRNVSEDNTNDLNRLEGSDQKQSKEREKELREQRIQSSLDQTTLYLEKEHKEILNRHSQFRVFTELECDKEIPYLSNRWNGSSKRTADTIEYPGMYQSLLDALVKRPITNESGHEYIEGSQIKNMSPEERNTTPLTREEYSSLIKMYPFCKDYILNPDTILLPDYSTAQDKLIGVLRCASQAREGPNKYLSLEMYLRNGLKEELVQKVIKSSPWTLTHKEKRKDQNKKKRVFKWFSFLKRSDRKSPQEYIPLNELASVSAYNAFVDFLSETCLLLLHCTMKKGRVLIRSEKNAIFDGFSSFISRIGKDLSKDITEKVTREVLLEISGCVDRFFNASFGNIDDIINRMSLNNIGSNGKYQEEISLRKAYESITNALQLPEELYNEFLLYPSLDKLYHKCVYLFLNKLNFPTTITTMSTDCKAICLVLYKLTYDILNSHKEARRYICGIAYKNTNLPRSIPMSLACYTSQIKETTKVIALEENNLQNTDLILSTSQKTTEQNILESTVVLSDEIVHSNHILTETSKSLQSHGNDQTTDCATPESQGELDLSLRVDKQPEQLEQLEQLEQTVQVVYSEEESISLEQLEQSQVSNNPKVIEAVELVETVEEIEEIEDKVSICQLSSLEHKNNNIPVTCYPHDLLAELQGHDLFIKCQMKNEIVDTSEDSSISEEEKKKEQERKERAKAKAMALGIPTPGLATKEDLKKKHRRDR